MVTETRLSQSMNTSEPHVTFSGSSISAKPAPPNATFSTRSKPSLKYTSVSEGLSANALTPIVLTVEDMVAFCRLA